MKILTDKPVKNLAAYIIISLAIFSVFAGCNDSREPTAPVEITRPKTNGFEPANGMLGFQVDQPLKLIFTEPMNLATLNGHFILKDRAGNLVEGTFQGQDSIVLFVPKQPLEKAAFYFAELRGRLRDAHNNSIEWNGDPVLNDTTLLYKGWFYTAGDYSSGGYYQVYLRDKKEGVIRSFSNLDQVTKLGEQFNAPQGMSLSSDGQYLIVSNTASNELVFINTTTNSAVAKLAVPAKPSSMIVNGDYVYITCEAIKTIVKVKVSTKTVEATFVETFYPGKIAASIDGTILYTLDQTKRDLVLLNSTDGKVIKTLSAAVDKQVVGEIRVDELTGNVYVCDAKGLKVKMTDKNGSSLNTIFTYSAAIEPIDIIFTAQNLLVAADKNIIRYDKTNNAPVDTISFATKVKSLTMLPSNDILYVTLATSVVIVDAKTFVVLKEIDLASSGVESIIVSRNKF